MEDIEHIVSYTHKNAPKGAIGQKVCVTNPNKLDNY